MKEGVIMDLICAMAKCLKERCPDISLDEGKIIAYAYTIRNKRFRAMIGNPRTPPDGYLDSTCGQGPIGSSHLMQAYCASLVDRGYLSRHDSQREMVRIADWLIPICEGIVNSLG